MKISRTTFITSLLVALLVAAPLTSFARENNAEKNGWRWGQRFAAKTEQRVDSSWWNKLSDTFTTRANAAVNNTPTISGITAPTVLNVGETGTWKVKASDPQNGSLSYAVDWGDASHAKAAFASRAYTQTSTFTHSYAEAGDYTVRFSVRNSAGLETESTVTVHVEGAEEEAPVISDVRATTSPDKPRNAVVSWDTDVDANSSVWFSTVSPVNTDRRADVFSRGRVTEHSVNLKRLAPDTTYYVVVGSANKNGNSVSEEISFKTPVKNDGQNPVITSLAGDTEVAVGEKATVTLKAYDPKNGSLSYSADWGDEGMMAKLMHDSPVVQTSTFSHVYSEAGTYKATFTAENAAGQKASASLKIVVTDAPDDTEGPIISSIEAEAGVDAGTIAWTTDEPASSKVYYSLASPVDVDSDATLSVSDDSFVIDHELDLDELTASSTYYFVIESEDEAGNVTLSSEGSLTTEADL